MPLTLDQRVHTLFASLRRRRGNLAFGRAGILAETIEQSLKRSRGRTFSCNADLNELYATAAVEMWQRGVHSFLMSAALTAASPIWSSVAGYYASHYCIRAFAHAIGFFHSYRRRRLLRLELSSNFMCHVEQTDREHVIYWKVHSDTSNPILAHIDN